MVLPTCHSGIAPPALQGIVVVVVVVVVVVAVVVVVVASSSCALPANAEEAYGEGSD